MKSGSRWWEQPADEKQEEKFSLTAKGHYYPVYVIQLAIQLIIQSLTSLRGVEKTLELLSNWWQVPTPDFSSIRQWGLRLGLYELTREKDYRSDWIFILDMTLELGQTKCLVILGITQERFTQITQQEQRGLQHQDVEVLALEILEQSPGKIIEEKLKNLASRVGTPLQILSDRGSDLKKGIDLYLEGKPQVIFTYDVTHKMASLLKKELSVDERYQNFLHQCSLTRHRLQQTELYFLVPPKQRSKARYHNVDILVDWAQKVLKYQESGDFSQISTTYSLDWETLFLLRDTLPRDAAAQLMKLIPKVYENQAAFTQALSAHFGEEVWQLQGELICQAAAVGRRKFQSKLGWLSTYQQEIDTYAELMNLVKTVEKQVKVKGLHRHSHLKWSEAIAALSLSVRGQKLKQQISDYLAAEGSQIPEGRTLLGTSDVVESLFGKYKNFSAARPLKEIGTVILTIPLCTVKITSDFVKIALETIRSLDVQAWSQSVLGQSMLSKRRTLQIAATDTKVA